MPTRILFSLVTFASFLALGTVGGEPARAPQGKKYALLVGVKEYDHSSLPDLKHTENDAVELGKVLEQAGFSVVLMTNANARNRKDDSLKPTAKNIRAQLARLTEKVTKHDLLLLALAGHGVQLTIADPITKKDRDESFFCPRDARPRGKTELAELKKTMIPLLELFRELEESGAGTKLLLIDACRNDTKGVTSRNMNVDSVPRPGSGVAALFSCKGGEKAFETDKLKHGVFFHFVIEGLKGKAKNDRDEITWSRLAEFVIEKVADEVPGIIGDGARQTPQELKNLTGKSPILVAGGKVDDAVVQKWFETAEKYDFGQGVEKDHAKAFALYKKAADRGHPAALNNVGSMYQAGEGVAKDNALAVKYYRIASDKGSFVAMNNLGFMYDRGLGVTKDAKVALGWYRKAADAGNDRGMFNVGLSYAAGEGITRDYKEAAKWYRAAADKGHANGMYYLASLYRQGQGVSADDKEAYRWYLEAAKKSIPGAMTWVGVFHETGRFVKVDYKEAVAWYQKAAALNEPFAMSNLGLMYESGRGVVQSDAEAMKWYEKSAKLEHGYGMYRVGMLYAHGKGVVKNDTEAVKWYRKAVAQDDPDALNELGMMYDHNRGVEKEDTAEAVKLFRRAAALNHALAHFNLGVMYERGRGVPQNLAEALRWYQKAAALGDEPAKKKVQELANKGKQ